MRSHTPLFFVHFLRRYKNLYENMIRPEQGRIRKMSRELPILKGQDGIERRKRRKQRA